MEGGNRLKMGKLLHRAISTVNKFPANPHAELYETRKEEPFSAEINNDSSQYMIVVYRWQS